MRQEGIGRPQLLRTVDQETVRLSLRSHHLREFLRDGGGLEVQRREVIVDTSVRIGVHVDISDSTFVLPRSAKQSRAPSK